MKHLSTACALCGEAQSTPVHRGTDRLYRTTNEQFTIARCAGCGISRLHPAPADTTPFYPDKYWHEPTRLEQIYRRLVIRDHLRFACGHMSAQTVRALDVGCGSGFFLHELQRTNPAARVVGLDASSRAAAVAWRSHQIPVVAASLTRAPFPDGSFDLITMFHVLEHLHDPAAYTDAARKLLAPGGRLIVQTPNLDCWQYGLAGARWSGLDIPRHLYNFRLKDLQLLLSRCGFRIHRIKHFSWRDNPASLATTIAPGLEPVARGVRGVASKNVLYAAITAAALPFAALEAMFGHGSSVMLEATAG